MMDTLTFRFLTSTPQDITRGSGTYVGISVLAGALRDLGHQVDFESPRRHFPVYTVERLWFNRGLRPSPRHNITVGYDMDGYRIAGEPGHVASLKGVIADEVRFESGLTRATMSLQARCERLHVRRASRVVVTSRYSGERAQEMYGLPDFPIVVPELIDLQTWRRHLDAAPAAESSRFTVLYVGRFYRRKRVNLLLDAAVELRAAIPELEIRIVGNGPCDAAWRAHSAQSKLEGTVTWLGDVSRAALAAEYSRADVFCLPSVQEGFGIVLLEAMAAGKAIVAARAAAIPEVVPHATLVDRESGSALAEGILNLYASPALRSSQSAHGLVRVEQFDARCVARLFVEAVSGKSG
uniref:Glycosyl transferase, group 1 n=1 Tax=Solibacter usitatus (strain Ellin6076) TaxID=234267 RepID=Q02CA0_SOLUE